MYLLTRININLHQMTFNEKYSSVLNVHPFQRIWHSWPTVTYLSMTPLLLFKRGLILGLCSLVIVINSDFNNHCNTWKFEQTDVIYHPKLNNTLFSIQHYSYCCLRKPCSRNQAVWYFISISMLSLAFYLISLSFWDQIYSFVYK